MAAQLMLEILQQADQAMYVAKFQGRNRVSVFEDIGPLLREAA
jgi:PleD family two-component response regulator